MRNFLIEGKTLKWLIVVLFTIFIFLAGFSNLMARTKEMTPQEISTYGSAKVSAGVCVANVQQRVHRVSKAAFCVTNWGFLGSQTLDYYENKGGCFNPNPDQLVKAPSFEYPIGSNLNYLFQGAVWFGGVVPGHGKREGKIDTLVSVGHDGWIWVNELFPDGPAPKGAIIERTIRPTVPNMQGSTNPCASNEAISEQDVVAVYTDTLSAIVPCSNSFDTYDNTTYPYQDQHTPLGIQITQKSYAWSYSYAEDFFLIDFWIKNINSNEDTIKSIYMGMYIDADVGHPDENLGGSQDDICGFLDTLRNAVDPTKLDTIATAWIADNDGFPDGDGPDKHNGAFFYKSCTNVTGVRIVRKPPEPSGSDTLADSLRFGEFFNWWLSDQAGGDLDWGPRMQKNLGKWSIINPYNSGNNYPPNLQGTPGGDISKYFVMSNREWDHDQVYSGIDFNSEGWLPPPPKGSTIAKGMDTRYLFSFGPIPSLAPGDSIPLTVGYIAGENFHTKPYNFLNTLNSDNPYESYEFMRNVDFTDFATNSQWAAWVYDNPDSTGKGDGIPDFKGPPPPSSPKLSFAVEQGEVTISWNGKETELERDAFTQKKDFEGYRIYMGEAKLGADYSLIYSADKVDFQLWRLNPAAYPLKFRQMFPAVLAESLGIWFWPSDTTLEQVFDSIKAHPDSINALVYTGSTKTLTVGPSSDEKLEIVSGQKFYFRPNDWNQGFAGIAKYPEYRDSIDSGILTDTLDQYWDYEYKVTGLLPSRQMVFAVTAFDYGNPSTSLDPLESSKSINEFKVYPLSSSQQVKAQGKKVVVYPNPYRIDGNYVNLGFEDPDRSGFKEATDRRLWFINLPSVCVIRIYTLDGDLVRELFHDGRGLTNPTMDYWNLISRNTQAVVSGIYLFSVEDKATGQIQVGKFVIIK